ARRRDRGRRAWARDGDLASRGRHVCIRCNRRRAHDRDLARLPRAATTMNADCCACNSLLGGQASYDNPRPKTQSMFGARARSWIRPQRARNAMKSCSLLVSATLAMMVTALVHAQPLQPVPAGCYAHLDGKVSCPPLGGELHVTLQGQ